MRRRSTKERRERGDGGRPTLEPGAGSLPSPAGYSDLSVIGHGASSTVYRAMQDGYDRLVALKVLNIDVSDRRAQRRFTRERALNGRLSSHPNVVTVLDSGFVDGRYPFLAMELFEQGSLSDRVAARGPFDVALALQVGVRIAGALESAHRIGVLHRDVKPQNVLLSRYGEPALADFGIAAILEMEHSVTAGLTPVHAAPEILEGADPTAQADVYALGSTIFTVLAGVAPFAGPPGEGMLAQLLRITTSDLPAMPRADVPESVVALLRWATAKRLDERAPSAGALGTALQQAQAELGLPVTPLPVERVDEAPDASAVPPVVPPPRPVDVRVDDTIDAVGTGEVPAAPPGSPPVPPPADVPLLGPAPSPVPAAVVPPVPVDHAPTVGAPVAASPTVMGRQHFPAATVTPGRGRGRRRALAAAALVAVAGAATAVVLVATGDDDPATSGTTVPATSPPATTTTAPGTTPPPTSIDVAAFVPTGVLVSTDTGEVLVSWTDQTGGAAPHFVATSRSGGDGPPLEFVEAGVTSTVLDVAPDEPACFQVRAVVSTSGPDAVTADSAWKCVNGAVAVTSTTGAPTSTT